MFITSCFIKKNTPELRKKLEELGYTYNGRDTASWGASALYCFDGKYYEVYPAKPSRYHSIVDCGTNEELFLALAALRDDSDYMQWFTYNNYWHKCLDNNFSKYAADWILFPDADVWHKATIEEIMEHFKDK